VRVAREEKIRAEFLLDDARVTHQRMDRELRMRSRYPDIPDDLVHALPLPGITYIYLPVYTYPDMQQVSRYPIAADAQQTYI
jgi:hypothetical protein